MLKGARRLLPWMALAAAFLASAPAAAADEPSLAEQALFMTDRLGSLTPPVRLHYVFRRSGRLEPGFTDSVDVSVEAAPGGGRSILTRCLSGERQVELPALEGADGNPALLCFLERDIRHMERLTGGRANHFRQRIRLALANSAELREVQTDVGGRHVAAREIRIAPYLDDPRRARFERYAGKYYVFQVSDDVPGGILAVTAVIPSDGAPGPDWPPLLADEMKWAAPDQEGKQEQ